MMTPEENETLSEADEIAALLPWYVTGKISDVDKDRVETYVQAHPEVERHIALAREEADAAFTVNQEIPAPLQALDRLKASLAGSPAVRLQGMKASLLERVGAFLGGLTPRQLAYAGIAAVLALVVQAASIGTLMVRDHDGGRSGYQTASGPKEAATAGTFALVSFKPAATAAAISTFLADSKFSIAEGPRAGGLYRVRLSGGVLSKAGADAALAKLKARADLIAFASAAPSSQ